MREEEEAGAKYGKRRMEDKDQVGWEKLRFIYILNIEWTPRKRRRWKDFY